MNNVVDIREHIDPDELERKLRVQMLLDAGEAWRALIGLSCYGMSDEIKLEATKLALAYTVGLPVQRTEMRMAGADKPRGLPALEALGDDELNALRVLRDNQKRRALESGDE
jgi:hypothetical protein